MDPRVAAFTDTYLPTVNGVTYTIKHWRDRWNGTMDIVYPDSDEYDPGPGEYPIKSVRFPFYEGYRMARPTVPKQLPTPDLVHVHTLFLVGLAGARLARKKSLPLVASYHTPSSEYTTYLSPSDRIDPYLRRLAEGYERWFLNRVDAVVVPTPTTETEVRSIAPDVDIYVVPNGVDTDFFRPVDTTSFMDRYDIDPAGPPIVGYTGRHGHEKRIDHLLSAVEDMDVRVFIGGDGPARESLERRARHMDTEITFLGFLDREDLPAFYAMLDVFAFPSPVETQGLVALEAIACGTPVVGVNAGAITDGIEHDRTGFLTPPEDIEAFRHAIVQAITEGDRLSTHCKTAAERFSLEHALEDLRAVYESVR